MLGTLLRFELKDDAAARGFDALAEQLIAAARAAEPETLVYVVHTVEDAPLSRVVYEVYANQDAAERHGSTDYFQHAMVELDQYVASARMEILGAPHGKLLADTLPTT
jgi:quinol monooxygenase YgiN